MLHDVDVVGVAGSDMAGEHVVAASVCASCAPRSPARGGPVAMTMTQQYVAGELSLLLAELRAVATSLVSERDANCLRREAETLPPAALTPQEAAEVKAFGHAH